jgi:hypothetical protein
MASYVMHFQQSTRMVGGEDLNHVAGLIQQSEKIRTDISKEIQAHESAKKLSVERASTTGEAGSLRPSDSICTELPVLRFRREKHNRHRSLKRDKCTEVKPTLTSCEDSDDNQSAHQTRILYEAFAEDQARTKRWACKIETLSDKFDDSMLPQLVARSIIPSPQKPILPLRGTPIRKTWNGTLRPQRERGSSQSPHDTFQRRASSSAATIATFEATETILMAEIDSDERCATFLRQRAPRETLTSHPDVEESSLSQIQYKLRALDRKIHMNREKLVQVRERIAQLGGKASCLAVLLSPDEPEENYLVTEKPGQVEDKSAVLQAKQRTKAISSPPAFEKRSTSAQAAALAIQCCFRAFRARRYLADLVAKTYQRILNPGNNEYFYYNRITRLSQWETPLLLRRCQCSLDAKQKPVTALPATANTDPALDAAAKKIQKLLRRRALKVFMHDLRLGNLEKVFDTGFGAWYYYNARTNRSFWESVHHVRLTACSSAIYHRQQLWQGA